MSQLQTRKESITTVCCIIQTKALQTEAFAICADHPSIYLSIYLCVMARLVSVVGSPDCQFDGGGGDHDDGGKRRRRQSVGRSVGRSVSRSVVE